MAKFYGVIGFAVLQEIEPGIWNSEIVEKKYSGDITRNTRRYSASSSTPNDNINIENQFSIIADQFMNAEIGNMKYLIYNGVKWKIKNAEIKYPRLILSIGDVYNG